MTASWFVSLALRPLLSSFSRRVASVLGAPCRTITTGKDHVKCGKYPRDRSLDIMLGTWVYDPDNIYGDPDEDFVVFGDRKKPVSLLSYIRNNGTWLFRLGLENRSTSIEYRFTLNTIFIAHHPANAACLRGIAQKKDRCSIKFTFCTLTSTECVFSFTTEVSADKLFYKTERDDGTIRTKVYLRQM